MKKLIKFLFNKEDLKYLNSLSILARVFLTFENRDFQTLLLRGCEWAATGDCALN